MLSKVEAYEQLAEAVGDQRRSFTPPSFMAVYVPAGVAQVCIEGRLRNDGSNKTLADYLVFAIKEAEGSLVQRALELAKVDALEQAEEAAAAAGAAIKKLAKGS